MLPLVYFSSQSENTYRFVTCLNLPADRIPLDIKQKLKIQTPYILLVPSYGGGSSQGAVPKQVIQFLNDSSNRNGIRGVIAAGNRNFGKGYCLAGDIIAKKCHVPYLYRFELMGTPNDIANVKAGVTQFW
ncbi:class Ib ribonucleoside-diphosphate reductase assembly flavoprotein NrdI [Candidatus Pantoea edessiphila]|uniref:Protein NrdI n=1 Tax=Candidatus Pantoea edessiphila TaxID=2044610 RepID=A0A2P5T331_9GAMM|nr:class Ib ribonucleoside-diphosphate reductase assembly flavoprotein NrdI [Candidatus Pantoea edessiphila]PPI88950.1 class Ib ribonucleoside-diphosphate reductase assembly flavoprotein NrdI [Candidatus Pantoea edessiphila]